METNTEFGISMSKIHFRAGGPLNEGAPYVLARVGIGTRCDRLAVPCVFADNHIPAATNPHN